MLKGYHIDLVRAKSNSNMDLIFCIAHLDQDVSEVLPYLNRILRGHQYTKEPPSVLFKMDGRIVVVRPREIAINSVKDASDAEETVEWLKGKINEAWEKRASIEPLFQATPRPVVMDILRLLGQTNCGSCGEPSCVVFALQLAEGLKEPEDCPILDEELRERVKDYLALFEVK
jgi:ArsR family metal-binding transcriptional regulator